MIIDDRARGSDREPPGIICLTDGSRISAHVAPPDPDRFPDPALARLALDLAARPGTCRPRRAGLDRPGTAPFTAALRSNSGRPGHTMQTRAAGAVPRHGAGAARPVRPGRAPFHALRCAAVPRQRQPSSIRRMSPVLIPVAAVDDARGGRTHRPGTGRSRARPVPSPAAPGRCSSAWPRGTSPAPPPGRLPPSGWG